MKNWKKESRFKDKAEDKLEVRLENARTRRIFTWIFEILVTLFFAIVVGIMMFQSVTMQESAMEPTLSVGERFLVNKGIYKISSPQRGDIIVFKTNGSDDAALHISRVIGLPGETVQISGGKILINGGDCFVKKYLTAEKNVLIDGVNQENVFTAYDFSNDTYTINDKSTREYYTDYLDFAMSHGCTAYTLEYATVPAIRRQAAAITEM